MQVWLSWVALSNSFLHGALVLHFCFHEWEYSAALYSFPVEMLVMLCNPLFAAYSVQVMKLISDAVAEKGYCCL